MEDYQYSPLPYSGRPIRLLRVLPADSAADPIICQFKHHSLQHKPEYAALSYTWGDSVYDHLITCDGRRIAISRNLYHAILKFRRTKCQMLWADAICINQSCIQERNQQVSIMGAIYKQASRVFVDLGPEEEHDDLAIKLMASLNRLSTFMLYNSEEKLKTLKTSDEQTSTLRSQALHLYSLQAAGYPGRENCDLRPAGLPHPQGVAWKALQGIVLRPWFARVWIIQEVALASHVTCFLGDKAFSWEFLSKPFFHLNIRRLELITMPISRKAIKNAPGTIGTVMQIDLLRENGQDRRLLALLVNFRRALSTDPRDKIYAMLGLASDVEGAPPQDYSRSVKDVYQDYALHLISRGLGLETLCHAGLTQGEPKPELKDLPSWVPNWSKNSADYLRYQFGLFQTASNTRPEIEIEADKLGITVKGIVVDRVSATAPALLSTTEFHENLHVTQWLQWEEETNRIAQTSRTKPSNNIDVYTRALVADGLLKGQEPTEEYSKFFKHQPPIDNYPSYKDEIYALALTHRFCVTETGYMAWIPLCSRPGDMVCVMLGGPLPFVLREVQEHCVLVGLAYVDGIMHGEALGFNDSNIQTFTIR